MRASAYYQKLAIYNVALAIGAFWIGFQMVLGSQGTLFAEAFPESWSANLPIDSWKFPGAIAIGLFGIGNGLAALLSFLKRSSAPYLSAVMGAFLFIGLAYQYSAVGEVYIVTMPLLLVSFVQIALSSVLYFKSQKKFGEQGRSRQA